MFLSHVASGSRVLHYSSRGDLAAQQEHIMNIRCSVVHGKSPRHLPAASVARLSKECRVSESVNRRGVPTPIGGLKLLIYRAVEGSLLDAYSQ